jgi:hypothetical protein
MSRICHVTIKLSRWRAKTMTTRASACNPIDSVLAAGSVRVPQNFINGTEVTRIDFGTSYKAVLGWRKALN